MDHSPPGSSVHGNIQARILERVTMPSSKGSSQSRHQNWVSCLVGRFFTIDPLGKAHKSLNGCKQKILRSCKLSADKGKLLNMEYWHWKKKKRLYCRIFYNSSPGHRPGACGLLSGRTVAPYSDINHLWRLTWLFRGRKPGGPLVLGS